MIGEENTKLTRRDTHHAMTQQQLLLFWYSSSTGTCACVSSEETGAEKEARLKNESMTADSRSNMDMLKAREVLVALKDFECIGVSLSFRVFIHFQHHGHRQLLGNPKPDAWRTIQCSPLNIDRPADMTTDQGPRYCLCNATGTNVDHPGGVEFQGGSCSYITRLRMTESGNQTKRTVRLHKQQRSSSQGGYFPSSMQLFIFPWDPRALSKGSPRTWLTITDEQDLITGINETIPSSVTCAGPSQAFVFVVWTLECRMV